MSSAIYLVGKPLTWCLHSLIAFLAPYLYIWAGRMDKTTDVVRSLLRTYFSTNRTGVPGKAHDSRRVLSANIWPWLSLSKGNDDSGAEGSFVVWSMMGLYPVSGTDVYLLSSPLFPEISLRLGPTQQFTITANRLSETNRYIQKATLNGLPFDRCWFRHSEVASASHSRLELEMGPEWTGYGAHKLPPSITGNVPWV